MLFCEEDKTRKIPGASARAGLKKWTLAGRLVGSEPSGSPVTLRSRSTREVQNKSSAMVKSNRFRFRTILHFDELPL